LFSRRIVGWSMGSRINARLVTDALNMALWQRQPKPGLIVHSDYAEDDVKPRNRAHACGSLGTALTFSA